MSRQIFLGRTIPYRVRIGTQDTEHRVHALTPNGFSVALATPLPPGTRVHVSFHARTALSISLEAIAGPGDTASASQWFDFAGADRELVNLLHSPGSWLTH